MPQQGTLDFGAPPAPATQHGGALEHLLRVQRLYLEPAVREYARGQEVLARFPDAERIEVASHWNIPGLHGNEGSAESWNRIKGSTLVLGVKKGLRFEPNGRSCDFIPPSAANGCVMACAYCYVPRNKGYANPVTLFVNIEQLLGAVRRHAERLGPKAEANSVDPRYWAYDIGCNSDCSADAALSDNVRDFVRLFTRVPNAMGTFATKLVNRELLSYDPQGKTRIRFSLMPAAKAKLLDVRTSPVSERIAAVDDFVAAGYEVHLNFSPVVLYEGWQQEYAELFQEVDARLGPAAKRQLAAEVILLTHNDALHEVNLRWHPRAEQLLWTPESQEAKPSSGRGVNVRYRTGFKGRAVAEFTALLEKHLPYCRVRYAF
ncbi:spore photoproduct lyase family protein [Aggregicoccus sp. 17bor-14]|uniref:spore photoproduct lyase family protein n=1 Tax=Myxococcaceae TaxID=31 RepID=UPI00129CCB93|nr:MULTISPECIES: spore photoproduct lyase family protein [Myxococcaceae]MBF5042366.1 spore photoproduct lyase family protein [Simulacricoccus sp. 17bor-14]MRI88139.1 spore photoproduct lyase family protein [Aggregicoccus sp. 17bor-14]